MENKDFRNALLANMKNELKDFTQIQRNLKKSRKLEFRPKDRSLQSIVDEINSNASKIQRLLFYYTWLKHGKKYWANREISSFWECRCNFDNNFGYPVSYKNKEVCWTKIYDDKTRSYINRPYTTYEESAIYSFKDYINVKIHEYNMQALTNYDFLINK